jgi:signal transduction histidine kinase
LKQEFNLDQVDILIRIPYEFPRLQCEPGEFQEILYHLSKNALQAMSQRGKLILRGSLSISSEEQAYATINLSDTGSGISQETLPNLFKPFFTTKSQGEGNGLGLYLVRKLVSKNVGRITVSSFKGFGTTFTLQFPLARVTPIKA